MWALAQDALHATPTELYDMAYDELYLTAQLRAEYYEMLYDG